MMSDEFVAAKNAGPLACFDLYICNIVSVYVVQSASNSDATVRYAPYEPDTKIEMLHERWGHTRGGVHMHDRLQAFGRQIYAYHDWPMSVRFWCICHCSALSFS